MSAEKSSGNGQEPVVRDCEHVTLEQVQRAFWEAHEKDLNRILELQETIDDAKPLLDQAAEDNKKFRLERAQFNRDRDGFLATIGTMEEEKASLAAANSELAAQNTALQTRLEQLVAENELLTKSLEKANELNGQLALERDEERDRANRLESQNGEQHQAVTDQRDQALEELEKLRGERDQLVADYEAFVDEVTPLLDEKLEKA